ncbi:MAG: hypothetical protein M1598_02765 [Actinobacteria bacterium]|nr:hypothetical protein [Actinomycetota bacterium]
MLEPLLVNAHQGDAAHAMAVDDVAAGITSMVVLAGAPTHHIGAADLADEEVFLKDVLSGEKPGAPLGMSNPRIPAPGLDGRPGRLGLLLGDHGRMGVRDGADPLAPVLVLLPDRKRVVTVPPAKAGELKEPVLTEIVVDRRHGPGPALGLGMGMGRSGNPSGLSTLPMPFSSSRISVLDSRSSIFNVTTIHRMTAAYSGTRRQRALRIS